MNIYKWYSDAFFILNTRNPLDWIRSRLNHGLLARYKAALNLPDDASVNRYWMREWTEHHAKVTTFFQDLPGRLLVYDIDHDNPQKLTDFLSAAWVLNPDLFGHENQTRQKSFTNLEVMNIVNRNDPCPCGSGKKYKHCCGSLADGAKQSAMMPETPTRNAFDLTAAKKQALDLQLGGKLPQAAALYRQILLNEPKDFDALHMLGVLQGQLGRPVEGLRLLLDALAVDDSDYPPLYDNLGRCIVAITKGIGGFEQAFCPEWAAADLPQRVFMEDLPPLSGPPPLVSIVIPSYNHERYVEEAIRSACSQTYANLELIVIDDGSRDGSVDRIRSALADATCPVEFVARENRGAHVTINEGIELAQGKYIGILNSDDRYPAHRIDCMVRMLEAFDKQWGFAGVRFIDAEGALLEYGQHRTADICMKGLDRLYSDNSITLGFAEFNYSISTGNLFFTKSLGKRLGGFRDFRYVHDWDFCLRALEIESPVFLHEPAYDYRLHGANTVKEGRERIAEDRERMLVGWGQGGGDGTDTDHPRASLIACARERAFITANQGHLIEHGRLVTLAKALYAKTRSAGQPA